MKGAVAFSYAQGGEDKSSAAPKQLSSIKETAIRIASLAIRLPNRTLTISDWNVEKGEKVAVIGRNGVGKTSIIEALLGLRAGALVDGSMLGEEFSLWRKSAKLRRSLGVQLQRAAFPGRPLVSELISMHRALYGYTSEDVISTLGLDMLAKRKYEYLSRGESQRVDLFLALAHRPALLFLDEPYTGLDPRYARRLGALLQSLEGTTLVMCCHTTEELSLATKIAWLRTDGLAYYGSPDDMRSALIGECRLHADCEDATTAREVLEIAQRDCSPIIFSKTEGCKVEIGGGSSLRQLARQLVSQQSVRMVEAGDTSLADLLRHCSRED